MDILLYLLLIDKYQIIYWGKEGKEEGLEVAKKRIIELKRPVLM